MHLTRNICILWDLFHTPIRQCPTVAVNWTENLSQPLRVLPGAHPRWCVYLDSAAVFSPSLACFPVSLSHRMSNFVVAFFKSCDLTPDVTKVCIVVLCPNVIFCCSRKKKKEKKCSAVIKDVLKRLASPRLTVKSCRI